MSHVLPVTPEEVKEAYLSGADTPDFVIEVVNELIGKHYHPSGFSIQQDVVVSALMAKHGNVTREQVFEQKWLNFERAFRQRGWDVEHVKPMLGDPTLAFFHFEEKEKGR